MMNSGGDGVLELQSCVEMMNPPKTSIISSLSLSLYNPQGECVDEWLEVGCLG